MSENVSGHDRRFCVYNFSLVSAYLCINCHVYQPSCQSVGLTVGRLMTLFDLATLLLLPFHTQPQSWTSFITQWFQNEPQIILFSLGGCLSITCGHNKNEPMAAVVFQFRRQSESVFVPTIKLLGQRKAAGVVPKTCQSSTTHFPYQRRRFYIMR